MALRAFAIQSPGKPRANRMHSIRYRVGLAPACSISLRPWPGATPDFFLDTPPDLHQIDWSQAMDVKLPHLGEGADSGTVVNLFVKEGDQISKDQPLLELENEKAVATIPSTISGKVTKVAVRVGEKIAVGQTILSVSGAESCQLRRGARGARI
jgi:hypothetical protein